MLSSFQPYRTDTLILLVRGVVEVEGTWYAKLDWPKKDKKGKK